MLKKGNKKGFTLAELLIVVAIIAVLTAIAVPLFVGSLEKANKAVKDANTRVVRGYAVSEILSNPAKYDSDGVETTETGTLTGPWYVTAALDKSGNITSVTITLGTKGSSGYTAPAGWKDETSSDGTSVKLTITTLKAA